MFLAVMCYSADDESADTDIDAELRVGKKIASTTIDMKEEDLLHKKY